MAINRETHVTVYTNGGSDIPYVDANSMAASTALAQLKAGTDVYAMASYNSGNPIYIFIPKHAVCYAEYKIDDQQSEPPTDATCPAE